ncbi:hypothetical protein N7488_003267 [Penicillium malachiteum]|nr:hypothetical protein N7488_003267 [Penicillium malachiteum]
MVLGIVMMTAMLPTMIGMNEASKGTRDHEERRREDSRKQRCHLTATCEVTEDLKQRLAVHNAHVCLGLDGRIYITKSHHPSLVLFNGGFFQHPDLSPGNTAGLVTISSETPPTLRWVFLDAETHEVKWGSKHQSDGQICGPFSWTKDEAYITLEDWEGWMAVRDPSDEARMKEELGLEDCGDVWKMCFDQNDDGADLPENAEVLEVRLRRTMASS